MDDEFPQEYRAMATDYNIPVVSTVWVVQSLIVGQVCDPGQHEQMTQLYDDENLWGPRCERLNANFSDITWMCYNLLIELRPAQIDFRIFLFSSSEFYAI